MTDTTVVPTAPTAPSGPSDESGLSRRRVLTGAAWATPAVLIATAAPALAASGDPQGTLTVTGNSSYSASRWVDGVGNVKAKQTAFYSQLVPSVGGGAVSKVVSMTATLVITNAANPFRWGIGNAEGGTAVWTLVGTPSRSGNTVTMVLNYAGALPFGAYEGANLDNFWAEVANSSATIAVALNALDEDGRSLTAGYGPA